MRVPSTIPFARDCCTHIGLYYVNGLRHVSKKITLLKPRPLSDSTSFGRPNLHAISINIPAAASAVTLVALVSITYLLAASIAMSRWSYPLAGSDCKPSICYLSPNASVLLPGSNTSRTNSLPFYSNISFAVSYYILHASKSAVLASYQSYL